MLLSIMDGTSSHNVSAVDLVFRDGIISSQVPEEYRKYIVDMRTSFTSLEDLIAGIDHVEDGELDIEWEMCIRDRCKVIVVLVDLAQEDGVRKLLASLEGREIHVLVNNACFGFRTPFSCLLYTSRCV